MTDTSFTALIKHAQITSKGAPLGVPRDWMQGRTAYGGLIAALSLKSMRRFVPPGRKVRSFLISFVGPVNSDPFIIQTQVLRSGTSVTTVESRLIQNDKICCTAVGSFGADRDSKISITPIELPDMAEPSNSLELPYIDGLTPAFTRHFNYRWAVGELPFSGGGGKEIGGWINFRETTDCLTEEWLIALTDAWPTPVLSRLERPAAASTLTWALKFVHLDRTTCSEYEWWAYHSDVDSAERGYAHEHSRLWDPDGHLAVYSHQTSTVFA